MIARCLNARWKGWESLWSACEEPPEDLRDDRGISTDRDRSILAAANPARRDGAGALGRRRAIPRICRPESALATAVRLPQGARSDRARRFQERQRQEALAGARPLPRP